ncbi:MAG: hypothetical protein EOO07_05840 [Chitinophagaceae bacterium]|nr:MAG: hypothetical protein EOO07_05840 [Chitinophagaceae bacterium]
MKVENQKQLQKLEGAEHSDGNVALSPSNFQLKIGFDGKRAANNVTGLGNYSRSLIEHLANRFPQSEYFVYTPKINASLRKHALFSKENVNLQLPPKNSTSPIWRSVGVVLELARQKIDLFHGLSQEIPFGLKENKIKSVVTIHDLIFLVKPEYYSFFDRIIYTYKSKYACKKADQIIAISEQTKKDIVQFYGTDPEKRQLWCSDFLAKPRPVRVFAALEFGRPRR